MKFMPWYHSFYNGYNRKKFLRISPIGFLLGYLISFIGLISYHRTRLVLCNQLLILHHLLLGVAPIDRPHGVPISHRALADKF